MPARYLSLSERSTYRSLEDVIGCKWSAAVVGALHRGIHRPGKLERYIPGISTKVLSERLRKLAAYGLITREDLSGASLHVEYRLTPTGERLAGVIEQLQALQIDHDGAQAQTAATPAKPRRARRRARQPAPLPSVRASGAAPSTR